MTHKLDLTRFYGLDHPYLYRSPDTLDIIRERFAAEITACASQCRTNSELLDALYAAMPPESGFAFPRKIGQGSTRRAYELPFGLVMKLERSHRLDPGELAYRACSDGYLLERRRVATFAELTTAIGHSLLVVRVYGAMLSFGPLPPNPSVIITERLKPLSERDEDDLIGIDYEHLAVGRDGRLKVFDRRFPLSARAEDDRPLKAVIPQRADGLWIGNIGTDKADRYFLLDSGNNIWEPCSLTDEFYPVVKGADNGWLPCSPYSAKHREQTVAFSQALVAIYRSERRKALGKESITTNSIVSTDGSSAVSLDADVHVANDHLQTI